MGHSIQGCAALRPGLYSIAPSGLNAGELLVLHPLDENLGRLGTDNAWVGHFAGAELGAEVPAADRNLLVTLGAVLVHQTDAAQFFEICREADLDRLDLQITLEFVELALGRQ